MGISYFILLVHGKSQEYIRPGMRMLFRDGRVRGVGIITSIPKVQAVIV
jgi:GTPase